MTARHAAAVLWAGLLIGCSPAADGPDAVVARFAGGAITVADVDAAVLALPSRERLQLGGGDLAPLAQLTRELAVDRILLGSQDFTALMATPEVQRERSIRRREALAQQFLQSRGLVVEPVTETDIEQRFRERYAGQEEPERRLAMNIFLRTGPDRSVEAARRQMEAARQRILRGESFSVVAEEISESESRHAGGALGWVRRGQLSPDLEQLLFGLAAGVPSEVVTTREGVHLFMVKLVLGGESHDLADLRTQIRRELQQEHQRAVVNQVLDGIEPPPGALMRSLDEVRATLAEGGPPSYVILRIDDFELDRGQLAEELETRRTSSLPGTTLDELLENILRSHRTRELIAYHCRTHGVELTPDAAAGCEREVQRFALERAREQLVDDEISDREEELQRYFEDNRPRFSTPLRVKLRLLRIPLDDRRAAGTVTELEALRPRLAAGDASLETLAERYGGAVVELGWQTLASLAPVGDGKLAYFAVTLSPGEVSPPFHDPAWLQMVRIEAREEPRPLDYEQARTAVRAAFRDRHGQQLYADAVDRLLSQAGFELDRDRLALVKSSR